MTRALDHVPIELTLAECVVLVRAPVLDGVEASVVGMDEADREITDDQPGHAGRRGGISARNGASALFLPVSHRVQRRRHRFLTVIRRGQRRGSRPTPPMQASRSPKETLIGFAGRSHPSWTWS